MSHFSRPAYRNAHQVQKFLMLLLFSGILVSKAFGRRPPAHLVSDLRRLSVSTDILLPGAGFPNSDRDSVMRSVTRTLWSTEGDSHPSRRSTCPWHYVRNTDPTRYPYKLYEAQCDHNQACTECAGAGAGVISHAGRCLNVTMPHFVLRQSPDRHGSLRYHIEVEMLSAGCTCTRPIVRRSVYDVSGPEPNE